MDCAIRIAEYCEKHLIEKPNFSEFIIKKPNFIFQLINSDKLYDEALQAIILVKRSNSLQTLMHKKIENELMEIQNSNFDFVGMKGFFLEKAYYPSKYVRFYNDIDILVKSKNGYKSYHNLIRHRFSLIKTKGVGDNKNYSIFLLRRYYFKLSLNYILSIISLQNNMIPLHACCVQTPSGLTCAFSGKSCSGKSTLIAQLLSKGWKFVSEELIICNIGDKNINTYIGPPFIRLSEESLCLILDRFDITSIKIASLDRKGLLWSERWHVSTSPIQLDKIVFIESGFSKNMLEMLSFSESIHKMFNNIYSTMFCNIMPKKNILNQISEICKKVDCQKYSCIDYPDVDYLENKIGKIGF